MQQKNDGALPSPNRITVAQVIQWYTSQRLEYSSQIALDARKKIMNEFAASALGKRKVKDCRAADMLHFIDSHQSLKSAWTRRRWLTALKRPFNYALRMGLLDRNPFAGLVVSEGRNRRDMKEDEFRAILRRARPAFRRVLIFMRHTGARCGEVRAAKPEHVRFGMDGKPASIVLPEHKTSYKVKDPRIIVLNHVASNLIAFLLRRSTDPKLPLFLSGRGTPWGIDSLCKHFRRNRERLGLPADAKLYGMRHLWGTRAIMSGLPTAVVAQLMGHASLTHTQRYIHLGDKVEFLQQAAEQAVRPMNR